MATDAGSSKQALIVGLLGVGCYPLSLLGAMLGLRAFLNLSAPGTPGRGLAIIAMLMPGLMLPVTLVEAALVRTPVRKSQIARWQPECRQYLVKLWAAEEVFHAAHGSYTEDPEDLQGIKLPANHHYTYVFGTHSLNVADDKAAISHLIQLNRQSIHTGQGDDGFRIACVAQVKDWVDVWTVSSDDRELDGGKALLPAGTPFNVYSGYAK